MITLIFPVYNDCERLELALSLYEKYFRFVIIDNYSTDNLEEICEKYNAKRFNRKTKGLIQKEDYKTAVSIAETEWIFPTSCSELIPYELIEKISEVIQNKDVDAIYFKRQTFLLGMPVLNVFPENKTIFNYARVFKKDCIDWRASKIHSEYPLVTDKKHVINDLFYYHFRSSSLNDIECKHADYADAQALSLYNDGKRFSIIRMYLSAFYQFFKVQITAFTFENFVTSMNQFQITINIYLRLGIIERYGVLNSTTQNDKIKQRIIDGYAK